jgi:8-oxo-dGTP pyrophosphatase MutT (NUDIX family)
VDPGESFQQAAVRELFEETGIDVEEVGPQIDQRTAVFQLPNGEMVEADERYFLVRVASSDISQDGWTQLEREIMAEHRWWSLNELHRTSEQVFPQGLSRILRSALQKVGSA